MQKDKLPRINGSCINVYNQLPAIKIIHYLIKIKIKATIFLFLTNSYFSETARVFYDNWFKENFFQMIATESVQENSCDILGCFKILSVLMSCVFVAP